MIEVPYFYQYEAILGNRASQLKVWNGLDFKMHIFVLLGSLKGILFSFVFSEKLEKLIWGGG